VQNAVAKAAVQHRSISVPTLPTQSLTPARASHWYSAGSKRTEVTSNVHPWVHCIQACLSEELLLQLDSPALVSPGSRCQVTNVSTLQNHLHMSPQFRIICTCQTPQDYLHMSKISRLSAQVKQSCIAHAVHRKQPIHVGLLSTHRVCGQDLCLLFGLVLAGKTSA